MYRTEFIIEPLTKCTFESEIEGWSGGGCDKCNKVQDSLNKVQ